MSLISETRSILLFSSFSSIITTILSNYFDIAEALFLYFCSISHLNYFSFLFSFYFLLLLFFSSICFSFFSFFLLPFIYHLFFLLLTSSLPCFIFQVDKINSQDEENQAENLRMKKNQILRPKGKSYIGF